MHGRFLKAAVILLVILCAFALSQCSDNTLAPFQPEVTSVKDNFQLQATGVTNRTATLTYQWENTGTRAKVNHSTTTTHGTAHVIIRDSGGSTVYDKALVPSLTDTTTVGSSGMWTILLELNQYSGTLNFRVQKL
jgi:hypothetical protein